MSERLLIRLQPDASLTWLTQDAAGKTLSASNAGAPPGETIARARQIVIVVPAESVLLLETSAVSQQRTQLARAIPFALEDQLASPVEDLHFAFPDKISGERIAVAIVAKSDMRRWLETMSEHGIRPDVVVPETLALPLRDGGTIMIDGSRIILRTGLDQGSVCTIDTLPDWLSVNAVPSAEVFDFRSAPAITLTIPARYHDRQRDPLTLFAAQLAQMPRLNLLQGEFAPSHRVVPVARLWQIAALLAGAALLLGFVYSIGDVWRLNSAAARLDIAERDVLHTAFPEFDRVAGDPRQLMDSALLRLRGGADAGGMLDVLARIGSVVSTATRVAVKTIEYHNATLEIALRAPDVATLDIVRERIANLGGLKAEITSSTSGSDGVEGRLRITGAKP